MISYVVYSTSNSDYQSWQCKLLEYSFKKVNQQGKLIRLCSYNTHDSNREFDTSDIAEIIKLPDYRTRWKDYTNDLDKDYGIVNKTESLKYWLFNYQGLKDTDNVLFLDPDMVFLKPITQTVTQGTIIGQKWGYSGVESWGPFIEYGSHIKDKLKEHSIFMYPYISTVGDMKKIINRYTSLCYQIKLDKYPHLWESDMFALVISTLENEINIKTIDNLGFYLPWINELHYENNNDIINSSVIHYPGTIEDINKERIFNKQYYTSQTKNFHWDRIDFNSAITNIERKFLHILDTYNLSKLTNFYWNDCELLDSLFGYKAEDKYLVFRPWPGGWNNIRMSLEIAACVAFLQNRILVLPPEYRMYLLKNYNSMSTFFDISDLGIKTISFEEFENKFNADGWDEIESISRVIDDDLVNNLLTTENEVPSTFIKNRGIKNINELEDKKILYFKDNLLGNFYLTIYSERLPEICKYVARHIHYNEEIFNEANKVINTLGDYYAIHIRRNDFQYKDLLLTIDQIYNNIKNIIPEGAKLYISTDETDKDFFNLLGDYYQLYFYDDVKHIIFSDINIDLIGPIEQIICTGAKVFVGNKLSTFSSYIYRLRGYMKNITDKRFLTYNVECQPDKEEDNWWISTWAREYPQVWESVNNMNYFNPQNIPPDNTPKKILVSIASYRDTQLTDTIDSLFKNQSGENEIIIGACMQDTEENYNNFKYKDHPNVKVHFIPYQEAKGVGWARYIIQQELLTNEDYFLQIDSHSRAIKNWDKILISQINRCPSQKVVLSTYPNGFDVLDEEEKYFEHTTCPYLKVSTIEPYQKLIPHSAGIVKEKPMLGFWVAAGFLFTKKEWIKEVPYNYDFYFNGEEDYLSVISFVNGWDVYVPDSSTIWHDYTDNRIQSPKKYRPLHWEDHPGIDSRLDLIEDLYKDAYGGEYKRTTEQFIELVKKISNYQEIISIEVEFDFNNIPMHDTSKKVNAIIFAFYDERGNELFRSDIMDEEIINRTRNPILFNIPTYIYLSITKCLWWVKYEDDLFDNRVELPVTRSNNKFLI